MTKKTIAPILLALVLGAVPASADRRSDDHDRNRRHEHEAYRSDHSQQDAKIQKQEAKIARLAERLDEATSELFSKAVTRNRNRNRNRSWREWRAVHALRTLERRADGFHAKVERHGASSRRSEQAYRELEYAYQVAAARCDELRSARRIRDEFGQVGHLMGKLDRRIAKLDQLEESRRHAKHRRDERSDRVSHRGDEDRRSSSHERKPWVAFRFGF